MMTESQRSLIEGFLKDNNYNFKYRPWRNFDESVESSQSVFVIQIDSREELGKLMQYIHNHVNITGEVEDSDDPVNIKCTAGWEVEPERHLLPYLLSCCGLFRRINPHRDESQKYAASFSLSATSRPDDICIQFSPTFQAINELTVNEKTDDDDNPVYTYTVKAGVRIAELTERLEKLGYNLLTSSLIRWISMIGALGTNVHGSYSEMGCVSSTLQSITCMAPNGDLFRCRGDQIARAMLRDDGVYGEFLPTEVNDETVQAIFEAIRGGHLGLYGPVLEAEMTCVEAMTMTETIKTFKNAKALTKALPEILESNESVSIIYHPPYEKNPKLDPYQVKIWNRTGDAPSDYDEASDFDKVLAEAQVEFSEDLMDFLVKYLPSVIPLVTRLANRLTVGKRGTEPFTASARTIMNAIGYRSFPNEDLYDESAIVPLGTDKDLTRSVEGSDEGPMTPAEHSEPTMLPLDMATLCRFIRSFLTFNEKYLLEASERGEYPLTLTNFLRFFKGQPGGFSPMTAARESEILYLAFDTVTHTHAPGRKTYFNAMLDKLIKLMVKYEIGVEGSRRPSNHLGKKMPKTIRSYRDICGDSAFDAAISARNLYKNAVATSTDDDVSWSVDPFVTYYDRRMLEMSTRYAIADEIEDSASEEDESAIYPRPSQDVALLTLQHWKQLCTMLHDKHCDCDELHALSDELDNAKALFTVSEEAATHNSSEALMPST